MSVEVIEQVADKLVGLGMPKLKPHPAGSWRQWLQHFADVPEIRLCPLCQTGRLVEKSGKFGQFIGCTNFTDGCRFTESM